jgi:sugar O-acyltransferase (sialic acid O-acetyltransferase NeuD family)
VSNQTRQGGNLVIISAGSLGREVLVWATQCIQAGAPWRVKGFLDSRADTLRGLPYDVPILAAPEDYQPADSDVFLCAIGDPAMKRRYAMRMEAKGGRFTRLIHPTALIGWNVEIGDGAIICPYTQLSCDLRLGRHVMLGTHSSAAHDTRVGDYSQISGACQINGHATIGEGVFLGSSATLLPKSRVEDWAYVGAGSVVLRRVKARVKVFGNPAMPIGTVESPE